MDVNPTCWSDAPPGRLTAPTGGIDLWLVDAEIDQAAETAARLELSADELARCDRLRIASKRTQAVAVRAALRRILSRYVGAEPGELAFAYGQFAKPRLSAPTTAPRLEFNVSHAGAWGLIGVTAARSVGVDIEEVRPLKNPASFARTVLSPAELTSLGASADDQHGSLLEAWTAKEAALKGAGLGVTISPAAVQWQRDGASSGLAYFNHDGRRQLWQVRLFVPAVGYCGAAAVPEGRPWGLTRTLRFHG